MKVKVNNKIAKYQLTGDTRAILRSCSFAIERIYKKILFKMSESLGK